ncbi:pyruvate dehydrogenase (acetyl-transferring) E1 component subunit alpha [Halostella sp. JP-L12]|uniref:pyruvate dehydrogenase (acetyl-transferring) E1 component subunit alpha n=1 Tax=Halostella TaxID=1843185 RepID=UPI000EF852B2|nr:pyruvate dehydrogenase (acetyl-transferring) E1 component subunit alpha [Halostella sp. JP-L12]
MVRVLGTDADDTGATGADLSADTARELYRTQVLARTFDEKAISLHRQGRIGTYAPMRGQEASQVGAAAALAETDYCFPTYRDHAMYLQRGTDLADVLRHLLGQGNYVDHRDDDVRTFPPTIPIATQLPHAVGVGMAADYRGDDVAALASFGDGATSEGDFHEALNFAGVFDAPAVFFCQNNGYAISVPTERQTASATIAQKADAYGFDGVRVDGNDVVAVYEVVSEALERARNGGGPTLVEAVTYRRGPHTTTDDPSKYRDDDGGDVPACAEKDPLDRTREYLEETHGWSEADETALREAAEREVQRAVETAEERPAPDVDEMFDNVFADPPARFDRQRDRVVESPEVDR